MKIKFNNIIKNKRKSEEKTKCYERIKRSSINSKIKEEKSTNYKNIANEKIKEIKREYNDNINNKDRNITPVFKVYKSGGQVIKYIPNNIKNIDNEEKKYINNKKSNVKNEYDFIEKTRNTSNVKKDSGNIRRTPKNSFLLFFLMVILAGASLFFSYKKYDDLNHESYAVYSSVSDNNEEVEKEVQEEQNPQANNKDVVQKQESEQEQETKNSKANQVVSASKTTTPTTTAKVVPLNFSKPLEGEILKIYSSDKVIYSKTLELWKTHEGVDIKANENTIVKAIEKGTVEKIYDDSFYGKTIVIDHGQGYKSSYSNLGEEVFVKEKQVVTKLAKIGKVGKTAIGEIKDETHLHFVLIKNNEITDPTSIFR